MTLVKVPKAALAAEIEAGHVTLFRMMGAAAAGALGGAIDAVAAAGLKKAGQACALLQWPEACCKCLRKGKGLQRVESTSIANRGVAYSFRFALPHCPACAGTASRKRPGAMGFVAAFLAITVPVIIVMMAVGAAQNRDSLMAGSLVVGPLVGLVLPLAWRKWRARAGQTSPYQAVYVSSIEADFSGAPTGCAIAFENDAYAAQFLALNRALGVVAAGS